MIICMIVSSKIRGKIEWSSGAVSAGSPVWVRGLELANNHDVRVSTGNAKPHDSPTSSPQRRPNHIQDTPQDRTWRRFDLVDAR